jgi:hypothetical protein
MDALFGVVHQEVLSRATDAARDQRAVAIVTQGRLITFAPCPPPNSMSAQDIESIIRILPAEPSLRVTAISYTLLEALMRDQSKCIPFLGHLLGFGYVGHRVVVFEGHPSAFTSGVRDSDVLIVDSGMLPFLQPDWARVARGVLRPAAKIFIHDRESYRLDVVVKSNNAKGWQRGEPDGEVSYVNCLLTTLAKGKVSSVRVISNQPLPDLGNLTSDPEELDWIAELPFRYDQLNADIVIKTIMRAAGWRWYHILKTTGSLTAQLATGQERRPVTFQLRITKAPNRARQLQIDV